MGISLSLPKKRPALCEAGSGFTPTVARATDPQTEMCVLGMSLSIAGLARNGRTTEGSGKWCFRSLKLRFRPPTLREIYASALSRSTHEFSGHRRLAAEYRAHLPIFELCESRSPGAFVMKTLLLFN